MSRHFLAVTACLVVAVALLLSTTTYSQRRRDSAAAEAAAREMSIRDYQPPSTLVVAEHPVPRAKYPVVDVHSHQRAGLSGARWDAIVGEMDDLNLQVLVNLSGGSGSRLATSRQAILDSAHPDRMVFFANLDFIGGVGPGFGARAAAQLEADIEAGAMGLKLFKDFGLRVSAPDGTRVPVDSPELDAVWEVCARHDVPVLIHTGEPAPFFEPVDASNERWLELTLLPQRRVPPSRYPTFEALMAERDRLFARHPDTRFIVAHMGWHANDLTRLGRFLDRLPNTYVETGAILAELGRQPRTARAFFEHYQDRILFGKDSYRASEFPYYWRVFETDDEYFDYYRDYHAFWKLYGLSLPDEVLQKIYFRNALAVVPGIPTTAFPN